MSIRCYQRRVILYTMNRSLPVEKLFIYFIILLILKWLFNLKTSYIKIRYAKNNNMQVTFNYLNFEFSKCFD